MTILKGNDKIWTILRVVVWEAAILYCAQLFTFAWDGTYTKSSILLLAMNVAELLTAMVACITSLFR